MKIKVTPGDIVQIESDALIVNLFEGVKHPGGATGAVDEALGGAISILIQEGEFKGELNQTAVIHSLGKIPAKRVIVAGLGKSGEFTADRIRQISATSLREARVLGAKSASTIVHGAGIAGFAPRGASQALTEGAILGLYKFDKYLEKKEKKEIEELLVVEFDEKKIPEVERGVEKGEVFAQAQNMVRDLVNEPSNQMTPRVLTEKAKEVTERFSLGIEVLAEEELRKTGAGAFLAVAKGSEEPCRLIVMRYETDPQAATVALIGKGITFDSGGVSIKPSKGMEEMKGDMAGGAAVIGAMQILAQLKPQVNVVGIIPATENMPSGHALKPGDVIKSLGGKSIEIISTDAEGRLVLADALTYAQRLGAGKIIDIATLTGGCTIALGNLTAALLGSDQKLVDLLLDISKETGERMWQLPLFEEYFDQIKSDIADVKNSGGRGASTIIGGMFLKQFVDKTPWTHVDMAGKELTDKQKGYLVKGATGYGTRTLAAAVLKM
jgi:leucyl aminopeptidase